MTAGGIEARGLTRRFGAKVAVEPFDVDVGPGGITGLLGPNGSGKSTFLRMLTGLVRPDAGSASVAGARLAGDGTAVRRRCAYMPGETALYGELSGRRHLKWFLRGREKEAFGRAVQLAERLGLPLGKPVRAYSHGMKRLLQFAAALAPRVALRILDEPTEGLDPSRRAEVLDVLRREAEDGGTVLLSSHHLAEVDRACDRLLFLMDGRLLADENATEIAERARRVLRLGFGPDTDMQRVSRALESLTAEEVLVIDRRVVIVLADADPRAALAGLMRDDRLPVPERIVYGELSLQELYRDLYGQEGV